MRRPDGTKPTDLHPEDYCRRGSRWWVCDPEGAYFPIDQGRWSVTEHDDGTISVSPSLDRAPFVGDDGQTVRPWHGFLRRGRWDPPAFPLNDGALAYAVACRLTNPETSNVEQNMATARDVIADIRAAGRLAPASRAEPCARCGGTRVAYALQRTLDRGDEHEVGGPCPDCATSRASSRTPGGPNA